jgi:tetratricopeptide (TPR) repeat protein
MLSVLEQYLNLPSPRKHAGKAQFLKGIRLYLDRNFEEAATAFQQAIQDPTLPPELVAQAQTQLAASWQELGQPDKAADLFSRSIAQGNADQLSDQTLLWLAHFHLEADRFEAAMAPLKPLMQRELPPKLKQAGLLARGYALLGLGQLDEAETALEQAMDLDSANQTGIEAALALADVSRADPAGLERAKELFASARDQAGGYWPELAARARFGLGQVALDMQQPAEAAKQFMGLAILYDIPDLTPRALALAAEAFQASGQPEAADEASAELKKRYPAFGSQPNSSSQNR